MLVYNVIIIMTKIYSHAKTFKATNLQKNREILINYKNMFDLVYFVGTL